MICQRLAASKGSLPPLHSRTGMGWVREWGGGSQCDGSEVMLPQ